MIDKGLNVLSLCDGVSCGRIALKELNVKVDNYYASEIDKFAVQQTKLNFPDTIHLGDMTNWKEWDIDFSKIDLILAGTPCQGFSFAGKMLAFDDPRSRLFFVFVDILNHIKSLNKDVKFLLENVNMRKADIAVINEYLRVSPVRINSNLVSAQNRDRFYWSNIRTNEVGLFGDPHTDIPQPKDRGIYLKDILEAEVDEKYYLSDKMINGFYEDKTPTLSSNSREHNNLLCIGGIKDGLFQPGKTSDFSQGARVYSTDFKSVTLNVLGGSQGAKTGLYMSENKIRRLTPTECAKLQTVPSWYKWNCSDTQQYKMLGNGWTIEVIKHILSYLKVT